MNNDGFVIQEGDLITLYSVESDKRIVDPGLEVLNELEHASSISFDQLLISGRKIDAVFFHLPKEPYGFFSNCDFVNNT